MNEIAPHVRTVDAVVDHGPILEGHNKTDTFDALEYARMCGFFHKRTNPMSEAEIAAILVDDLSNAINQPLYNCTGTPNRPKEEVIKEVQCEVRDYDHVVMLDKKPLTLNDFPRMKSYVHKGIRYPYQVYP